MAKKGQQFRSFHPEFKRKAVKMYLEKHMGLKSIAKELDHPSHSYVKRWVKAYQEKGEEEVKDQRGLPGKKKGQSPKNKKLGRGKSTATGRK